jgi:signal transduction histidine kinase
MLVMTDLLKEDCEHSKLPVEKKTEFINNIHLQLERIEWLVSSLLKLSKLDAGAVIFKQERISAIALIQKISAPFFILTDIKGQQLEIKGSGNPFCTLDINWTAEALTNILKNCIDHTPEGGKIEIKYEENPLYTEIIIKDNGSGIDKKDLPYIFNRYYKARNANEDSVGIGLALTKNILQAQNADVTVKSSLGEGTEFSVKFYGKN